MNPVIKQLFTDQANDNAIQLLVDQYSMRQEMRRLWPWQTRYWLLWVEVRAIDRLLDAGFIVSGALPEA